ncbi:MAG: hypothetical protein PQ975_06240 [Methanobacterium sp.]
MKKGAQKLLRNKAVRTILEGANFLIKPLKKLIKPYIKKISERLRGIKQKDVWRRIVNVSELINLDPKAWANAAAAIGKRFGKTWIGRKVSNIPTIVGDAIKIITQGPKGGIEVLLDLFSKMTPKAIKNVKSTKFQWLKNLTNTKVYKDVHGVISPVIKRYLALQNIYHAARRVYWAFKRPSRVTDALRRATGEIRRAVSRAAERAAREVRRRVKRAKVFRRAAERVTRPVRRRIEREIRRAREAVRVVERVTRPVRRRIEREIRRAREAVRVVERTWNGFRRQIGWR